MAINFPNNPTVNDTFTVGGTKFTFTGVKWETSAVVEISSDTTPSLGGALDAGTHNINNVGIITATTFSGNLALVTHKDLLVIQIFKFYQCNCSWKSRCSRNNYNY